VRCECMACGRTLHWYYPWRSSFSAIPWPLVDAVVSNMWQVPRHTTRNTTIGKRVRQTRAFPGNHPRAPFRQTCWRRRRVSTLSARGLATSEAATRLCGQSVFVHGHCRRCAVVCSWASLRRNVDPESMPGVWNEASTRAFTRQVSICSKCDILHARYDLENSVR
jgi:hypothetical protein